MVAIRVSRFATVGLALLFAICMVSSGLAQESQFTTIDSPGARLTGALGISPDGTIVGYYVTFDSPRYHGFLLRQGAFTTIDLPGDPGNTFVQGINPQGDIVGEYSDAGGTHGFLLKEGQLTTIDFPGASATLSQGINSDGTIVGFYGDATGTHGFVLKEGRFTTINLGNSHGTAAFGINSAGTIVGDYFDATGVHGYWMTSDSGDLEGEPGQGAFTTIDFPGASGTAAYGINSDGTIVGVYFDATGSHGFLLKEGAFTTIDFPGAPGNTFAVGINPEGRIVGEYFDATSEHGFLLSK